MLILEFSSSGCTIFPFISPLSTPEPVSPVKKKRAQPLLVFTASLGKRYCF